MKLSSQEEFGLRCLLQLARRGAAASATIPEISHAEGMTIPHVAKMMRALRKTGLVKSVRGKDGGYTLARPAGEILLSDIFSALGGKIFDAEFCGKHSGTEKLCAHTSDCSVRSLLFTLQKVLDGVLVRITLNDLLRNEHQAKIWMEEEAAPRGLRLIVSEK